MTTESLIERLAAQLRPTPRRAVARRLAGLAGAGVIVSVVLVGLTLGFRPDLPSALGTPMFWTKLAYTLALGGISIWALERLSRPATPARERMLWLLAPVGVVLALCTGQLAGAPGGDRMPLVMGDTAAVCPWRILTFSAPPFLALVWAVRGLAPTSPRVTGAVLGVCAGGLGAAAYALACTESAAPFLATWYNLAIVGVALIGYLAAPWALRW
ncbi:MAG TPA: DUF1109 domain-containing protein [Caulobacteraceae bacterium]|nr:DUF1109 domain-containing protein [Caulobacteraceae bacterium]